MTTLTCRYDPVTLREVYSDNELLNAEIERLMTKVRIYPDPAMQLEDLGELVGLLHGAGRDYDALCFASWAVEIARKGTEVQMHVASVRLARAQQREGDYVESNLDFVQLMTDAESYGPQIAAMTNLYAGENDYAQGHWLDARERFTRLLTICEEHRFPTAAANVALSATLRKLESA